tara:strand:+ start:2495 stop:4993 length:2499 start_codon:yes stop_codon:yes gene_type:complete
MAVLNFPAFPSNGDTYIENGVTYTYSGTASSGFWQADNKNVAPTPDPNVTVTGSLTVVSEAGTGDAVAFLNSAGEVQRGDATTPLVGPFALKSGDSFTGNVAITNNSRLGIGTTSPDSALEIESANPIIELTNSSTGNSGVVFSSGTTADGSIAYNNSNDRLEVYTGDIAGSPEMVIDSSGRLGLGQTVPEARLEVKDDEGFQITKADGATKWNFIPSTQLLLTEQVTGNTVLRVTNSDEVGIGGDPTLFSNFKNLGVFGEGITIDNNGNTGIQFSSSNTPKASIIYDHSTAQAEIDTDNTPIIYKNVGNIGVRKLTPTAPLHVAGQVKVEGAPITIINGAEVAIDSQGAGTTSNDAFALQTNSIDRLTISANGNVTSSSGDSSPTFVFQDTAGAANRAGAGFTINPSNTSTNRVASLVLNADGGDITGSGRFSISQDGDQDVEFKQYGGDNVSFKFENTEVAKFSSTGNVVVGSDAATNGNKLTIDTASKSGISFITDGSSGGQISGGNPQRFGGDIELITSNDLIIRNNEVNRDIEFIGDYNTLMTLVNDGADKRQAVIGGKTRWNADGEILLTVGDATFDKSGIEIRGDDEQSIKFTQTNNSADNFSEINHTPTNGFSFNTSTSSPEKVRIRENGRIETYTTSTSAAIEIGTNRTASSLDTLVNASASATSTGSGGVNVLKIYTNGDVQNLNNNYGAISDIKLKKNIKEAQSQWDDIKSVKLKNFEFKNSAMGTDKYLGVIAQDLQEISPGLINETEDVIVSESPVFDADGNPSLDKDGNQITQKVENKTGDTTLNVKYSVLYLKAIGALQEAMSRIEQLESKVSSLES